MFQKVALRVACLWPLQLLWPVTQPCSARFSKAALIILAGSCTGMARACEYCQSEGGGGGGRPVLRCVRIPVWFHAKLECPCHCAESLYCGDGECPLPPPLAASATPCVPVLCIRAAAVTEQQAQGEAAAVFVYLLGQVSKRKGALWRQRGKASRTHLSPARVLEGGALNGPWQCPWAVDCKHGSNRKGALSLAPIFVFADMRK